MSVGKPGLFVTEGRRCIAALHQLFTTNCIHDVTPTAANTGDEVREGETSLSLNKLPFSAQCWRPMPFPLEILTLYGHQESRLLRQQSLAP